MAVLTYELRANSQLIQIGGSMQAPGVLVNDTDLGRPAGANRPPWSGLVKRRLKGFEPSTSTWQSGRSPTNYLPQSVDLQGFVIG